MGRPHADALHRGELRHDRVVVELVEAVQLQLAAEHVLGEGAQVGGLGAGQPRGLAQGVGVGVEHLRRRGRRLVEEREQAAVDGAGRLGGELLADGMSTLPTTPSSLSVEWPSQLTWEKPNPAIVAPTSPPRSA